ncbi:MmcQ/YjbR family DNA-binding protein [Glaciihabitans arcticus]|uniref:MmcQ/YjbR family DNA-binding protein n=1 Tax=Glaciihabitans arcticus TaxID=2668039 RepID=A0A4Q9GVR8_9MICO|nr:MmcQ/YjbR family DNA-binding protein [Glaciihabitans arcticus]TBN58354.1 MmcQ/YjbR family DNA-binding protein [Glaciihabitans arcticus]
MATWDDVSRLALSLPRVVEGSDTNGLKWEISRRYFAYERPVRRRDLEELGDAMPTGDLLGVLVPDLADKLGLIGSDPEVFFTMPRYAEYPAVLVILDRVSLDQLNEVLIEAWLCRAPKRLAAEYLAGR